MKQHTQGARSANSLPHSYAISHWFLLPSWHPYKILRITWLGSNSSCTIILVGKREDTRLNLENFLGT